jgi:hypothetical protein
MEMEQMMACLLAEMKAVIRTNEAKVDISLKEIMARLKAMIPNYREKIMAKLVAHHEMMTVMMDSQPEKIEAAVETIRTLEDQYGNLHLSVGHHQQPKKWTQHDGGSWQKLPAAQGWLTWHAIPAPCKGHSHQES